MSPEYALGQQKLSLGPFDPLSHFLTHPHRGFERPFGCLIDEIVFMKGETWALDNKLLMITLDYLITRHYLITLYYRLLVCICMRIPEKA